MNVVLISDDSRSADYLARTLFSHSFELSAIIVLDHQEHRHGFRGKVAHLRRLLSEKVFLSGKGRKALKREGKDRLIAQNVLDDFLSENQLPKLPESIFQMHVPSLNEATVVTAIKNAKPDIIVLWGVRNVRSRILSLAKLAAVDVHTSLLPNYAGYFPEFWQFFNEDYQSVGVSAFTKVDARTIGSVIFKCVTNVNIVQGPEELRSSNQIALLRSFPQILSSIENGTASGIKLEQGTTPDYKRRDLSLNRRISLYSRLAKSDRY